MQNCLNQFKHLASINDSMTQAVENICDDSQHQNGNIPDSIKNIMKETCSKYSPDHTDHLEQLVDAQQTVKNIKDETHYKPTTYPCDNLTLCRIISWNNFEKFHISSDVHSNKDQEVFRSYGQHASIDDILNDIKSELKDKSECKIDPLLLEGFTGQFGKPTWWTFQLNSQPVSNAEQYMIELALDKTTIEDARNDHNAIELSINYNDLNLDLYKPNALDGYRENTKFRPELTDKPYGLTCPSDTNGQKFEPRPELISKSVAYKEIKAQNISIKRLTF